MQEDLAQDLLTATSLKQRRLRKELVERGAKGVDVGALVEHAAAPCLLR